MCHLDNSLASFPAGDQLLVDEEADKADADNADDAEDGNDTGLLGSPVLALGEGGIGVASDDGGADGGHFSY